MCRMGDCCQHTTCSFQTRKWAGMPDFSKIKNVDPCEGQQEARGASISEVRGRAGAGYAVT